MRPRHPAAALAAAALAAATVAFAAAGCGASSSAGPAVASTPSLSSGVQQVTVTATDQLRFQPATITVHPGRVRITLADPGSYPHNLSIPALHRTSASVSGSPGERHAVLDVTFPTRGTYRFVCTFHDSAGMVGSIVVR